MPACSSGTRANEVLKGACDLFGQESYTDISAGELGVEYELLSRRQTMIDRSNWLIEHLDPVENVLLDMEGHILLGQVTGCFVNGMDAATIICAVAFVERLLTDALEIRGRDHTTKRGLGNILSELEKLNLMDPFLVSRLQHLNRVRVNFTHDKGPDSEYSLFQRKLRILRRWPDVEFPEELILRNDAREAICFCYLLAERVQRHFPRLNLPGHPSISEELKNVPIFRI